MMENRKQNDSLTWAEIELMQGSDSNRRSCYKKKRKQCSAYLKIPIDYYWKSPEYYNIYELLNQSNTNVTEAKKKKKLLPQVASSKSRPLLVMSFVRISRWK